MTKKELAKYIDHTLLKPDITTSDIEKLCKEAIKYEFYSVCVNPNFVLTARQFLKGSRVKIACVVGFPLGEHRTQIKVKETELAIEDGADEIDMVLSISALKNKDYNYVLNDIKAVTKAAKNAIVKVIFETSKLTEEEIVKACSLCVKADAKIVKTSTGFLGEGATVENVSLMSKCVSKYNVGVKASGGIRDYETALKMIEAGATRLGTSSGIKIIENAE